MVIVITSNLINIVGNYLLIYGKYGFPEMGLMGAGISTLIARLYTIVAMVGYFLYSKKMAGFRQGFMASHNSSTHMKEITKLGTPVCLQMMLESTSFSLLITFISNGFIILNFDNLVSFFTTSSEVKVLASILLVPFVLYQVGDGLQIFFSNALRGIQRVKPILPIAFIAYIVISLPASYIFGFIFGLGLKGIWFGYPIFLTFAGVLYYAKFRKYQKLLHNAE